VCGWQQHKGVATGVNVVDAIAAGVDSAVTVTAVHNNVVPAGEAPLALLEPLLQLLLADL
jgi:hypothetical protein